MDFIPKSSKREYKLYLQYPKLLFLKTTFWMLTLISLQIIIFLRVIFFISSHLLILGFILILISICLGFMIYLYALSTWIRYLLVIVFTRGMIIILMYIISLARNDFIKNKKVPFIVALIRAGLFPFMAKILDPLNFSYNMSNNLTDINIPLTKLTIFKRYRSTVLEITLILIIYLLIVLITAVKIASLNKGPLRTRK